MEDTYVPFSSDIQPYVPGEVNPVYSPSSYSCLPVKTHCYVCGKGWGYGYGKHCWCKPDQVPVGEGNITLGILLILYCIYKYAKGK